MGYIQKKRVAAKLRDFHRTVKRNNGHIGTAPRIIDLSYDNRCNFHCQHCFTNAPKGVNAEKHIPLEKLAGIADEADELGFYEFDLQGGELLIDPELFFRLTETIGTERFYTYLTTNGYFLDEKMSKRLASAGIDRVSVSVDGMDAHQHDAFRGKKGAYDRAIRALEYVRDAGMEACMNITVGHYNIFSDELRRQLAFCSEKGFSSVLNAAVPAGCWKGQYEVMLTEEDRRHLGELRKEFPNATRDIWNPFDRNQEALLGCNAGNILYITPWGDVLPCPFLHIKVGNVYVLSLKEILDRAFSISWFSEYSEKCLAGEDEVFVRNFLSGDITTENPAELMELFGTKGTV